MPSPVPAPPERTDPTGALPDYWSFVEAAKRRISEEFPDADLSANQMFLSLNRASSTVIYDFESTIHRPAGRTWSSFRLLLALWVTGPLSPNEVARLAGMSKAAVSSLVTTLLNKGLLFREASPIDGRSVILHLTKAGIADIRDAFQVQNERESQWAEVLTEEEQETLVGLLEKVMTQRKTIGARYRN